ncbi:hypothetical protein EVAR_21424_1 [Eumeta japonica]|uniref:Uncharacterized protein n=1 Tax=Eumeta variegata TaxID=151549 RepID=A0A4C1VH42_EUMVA|nr:hypothetical protein EVAR_21424_1 [Eumeta japonica]
MICTLSIEIFVSWAIKPTVTRGSNERFFLIFHHLLPLSPSLATNTVRDPSEANLLEHLTSEYQRLTVRVRVVLWPTRLHHKNGPARPQRHYTVIECKREVTVSTIAIRSMSKSYGGQLLHPSTAPFPLSAHFSSNRHSVPSQDDSKHTGHFSVIASHDGHMRVHRKGNSKSIREARKRGRRATTTRILIGHAHVRALCRSSTLPFGPVRRGRIPSVASRVSRELLIQSLSQACGWDMRYIGFPGRCEVAATPEGRRAPLAHTPRTRRSPRAPRVNINVSQIDFISFDVERFTVVFEGEVR